MIQLSRAKKEYKCSICGRKINKGEVYKKLLASNYYINDFIINPTIYFCSDCNIDANLGQKQIVTLFVIKSILTSPTYVENIIKIVIAYNNKWHGKNSDILDKLSADIYEILDHKENKNARDN